MKDPVNSWIEQAWSALESIPGTSEAVARERLRWDEFHGLNTLEVVVFGAYDAGKSSLLKRLLVDWRIPVPEWLTVSGRRETFESMRTEAQGLGLTDTPGLGGGNSGHDNRTFGALRLADAFLWVLPPQLVTTGKERFLEIMFGDVGIAEATIAVVARMDEAGVDPSDNVAGFTALCLRKKEEFSSLVAAASSARDLRSVHFVVADPYQMVGSMLRPEPEQYDIGRRWDGIRQLTNEVLALREKRPELRSQAGARFARLLLSEARDELGRHAEDLTLSKEGMDNEVDRHPIYEQQLDALQRQKRAELSREIEDALLSVSRSGDVGSDSIQGLEKRLGKVVDEWAEGSFAAFRQLVGELELNVRERMARASMDGIRRIAREVEVQEGQSQSPKIDPLKLGRKALAFGPALRKSFEKYAEAELGMTIRVAADRLRKLESSGETVEAYIKSQGRRASFRGAGHAKRASQFVQWARVLATVGPLVDQLGRVLIEIADVFKSEERADERKRKRLELRRELRAEAEKLEQTLAADFDSTCDGLRRWLSERLAAIKSAQGSLSEQLRQIDESVASINILVASCPVGCKYSAGFNSRVCKDIGSAKISP